MRIGNLRQKRQFLALMALLLLASSMFVGALAQTKQPTTNAPSTDSGGVTLSTGALTTSPTTPASQYDNSQQQTTYVQQAAEQNTQGVITNVNNQLLQGSDLGQYNETYQGLNKFWSTDIVSNFFQNIGQVIGRWLSEFINGWVSDAAQFLTAFLRTFVLNPNIAVNGIQNNLGGTTTGQTNSNDDISPYVRQGADTMYGIAVDLLLLLFILCVWKYWVDAAWRGGVGLMGSVGRLIATAGLLLAWPTIYAFEIQITNEMIQAIYFNSADQVMQMDVAMAAAIKGGLLAGAGLLASAFAPVIGTLAGGALAGGAGGLVLGTVGDLVAFAGLIIYLILGVVLITEIIYILVLKAIQTALLTAQYMFAPIFIVFFATPDTESICSGFVRSFVEVSLWTFVWVGLLKIMVIILFSNFNPWGKIVLAVGVLQLMIQVPSFLARAQISPASDFISAGNIAGGLQKGVGTLAKTLQSRIGQGFDYMTNQKYAARGLEQSQSVPLNRLPQTPADQKLFNDIEKTKNGPPGGGNPGPAAGAKEKKKKIDPLTGMNTAATPPLRTAAGAATGGRPGQQTGTGAGGAGNSPAGASKPLNQDRKEKGDMAERLAAMNMARGLGEGLTEKQKEEAKNGQDAARANAHTHGQVNARNLDASRTGADRNKDDQSRKAQMTERLQNMQRARNGENGTVKPEVGSKNLDVKPSGLATGQVKPPNATGGKSTPGGGVNATGEQAQAIPGGQSGTGMPIDMDATSRGARGLDASAGKGDLRMRERLMNGLPGRDATMQGTAQRLVGGAAAGTAGTLRIGAPTLGAAGGSGRTAAGQVSGRAMGAGEANQGNNVDPTTAMFSDIMGKSFSGSGTTSGNGTPNPFIKYTQAGYTLQAARQLAMQIRQGEGPTMGPSRSGNANIVGDAKGHVNHVRFGAGAGAPQQAMQMLVAGYAGIFSNDAEAYDAARSAAIDAKEDGPKGTMERMAAGWMAYNGSSFKQTALAKGRFQRSLFKHAVLGSQAYVNGESGNQYTEYLRTREGEFSPQQQAWGVHIMTDETSPQSAWNPSVATATESLNQNGIARNAATIGAASNQFVMAKRPYERGSAIRGTSVFLRSSADAMCAPDTNAMVKDAVVGRLSGNMSQSVVDACQVISEQLGPEYCSDHGLVARVASLSSGGTMVDTQNALRNMSTVVSLISRSGGGGGGGFRGGGGGGINLPPSGGGGGGGPMGGPGNVTFQNGGGGGGGGFSQNQVVDAFVSEPPASGFSGNLGNIPTPNMGGARRQTQVNFMGGNRGNSTIHHRMDANVPVGSAGGQEFTIGSSGGLGSAIQRTELDVSAHMVAPNAGVPQLPGNLPGMSANVRRQVHVNLRAPGGQNGVINGIGQSFSIQTEGSTTQGATETIVSGGSSANETVEQTTYVQGEIAPPSRAAQASALSGADVFDAVHRTAASFGSNVHYAERMIVDFKAAGFTDGQIQDPNVCAAAMTIQAQRPDMLQSAAISTRVMGSNPNVSETVDHAQTVHVMMNSGCNPSRISRPDVIAAQGLIGQGIQPTPNAIREYWEIRQENAGPRLPRGTNEQHYANDPRNNRR